MTTAGTGLVPLARNTASIITAACSAAIQESLTRSSSCPGLPIAPVRPAPMAASNIRTRSWPSAAREASISSEMVLPCLPSSPVLWAWCAPGQALPQRGLARLLGPAGSLLALLVRGLVAVGVADGDVRRRRTLPGAQGVLAGRGKAERRPATQRGQAAAPAGTGRREGRRAVAAGAAGQPGPDQLGVLVGQPAVALDQLARSGKVAEAASAAAVLHHVRDLVRQGPAAAPLGRAAEHDVRADAERAVVTALADQARPAAGAPGSPPRSAPVRCSKSARTSGGKAAPAATAAAPACWPAGPAVPARTVPDPCGQPPPASRSACCSAVPGVAQADRRSVPARQPIYPRTADGVIPVMLRAGRHRCVSTASRTGRRRLGDAARPTITS